MYENLVDKLKVKKKTVNDKPKIRFHWLGSLDLLKDFVTLVLKKSGSWSESRKSSISFKTANLTITFYKNTLTLQLQGNKATEIANLLISLKETEASTKSNKGRIDESCSTVLPDDKTQSDALSVSSGSTSPSYHSSSYSPTGPNITQWSELVSNFQPDTPQLFDQNGDNVNSGLLQEALDQLATFESDLANIRKENHSKWLSDISRKERFYSSTKEGQELMEQTVIDSELLTRMVQTLITSLKVWTLKVFSLC